MEMCSVFDHSTICLTLEVHGKQKVQETDEKGKPREGSLARSAECKALERYPNSLWNVCAVRFMSFTTIEKFMKITLSLKMAEGRIIDFSLIEKYYLLQEWPPRWLVSSRRRLPRQ